jgi:hypothetical protein
METIFKVIFLIFDVLALTANSTTLIYILQSFEVTTHVFGLLFLDALISTSCSFVAFTVDSLLLANQVSTTYLICTLAFLMTNLPCCFGALLTLLISQVRLTLAKKASKNIHPSNKKVIFVTLTLFLIISTSIVLYYGVNAMLNFPVAYFVDTCAYPNDEPRLFTQLHILVLQMPNAFNVASLVTDVQMLRFLKTVILPVNQHNEGSFPNTRF